MLRLKSTVYCFRYCLSPTIKYKILSNVLYSSVKHRNRNIRKKKKKIRRKKKKIKIKENFVRHHLHGKRAK